jgi:glycosyltransferase involved in cell wall biosynthesis
MKLTVLTVPFPFAPLNEDPVGGAEQISAHLDRALVSQGHSSVVIAAHGSRTAGHLVPLPNITHVPHERARKDVQNAVEEAIHSVLARARIDLIHFHGLDFSSYLPSSDVPALATLHLPIAAYPSAALRSRRPFTWLNTVSASQARTAPADVRLLTVIQNGVAVEAFPLPIRKRRFAVVLGRVCPEKGFHSAIDASVRAGVPLLIAGQVFAWAEHQRYFDSEIVPRLDRLRRWVGPVTGHRKRKLFAAARCVLIPSLAPETSSLVAMEALAAGTPVIATRVGALPEIVEHGRTGFIVDDVGSMASALHEIERIDPKVCRAAACERFALDRMTGAYLALYAQLVSHHRLATARPDAKVREPMFVAETSAC